MNFFYSVSSIFDSLFTHINFFFLTNDFNTFISYPFPLKNELSSRTIEQHAKLLDKLKVANRKGKSPFYLNSTVKISDGIHSFLEPIFYSQISFEKFFTSTSCSILLELWQSIFVYTKLSSIDFLVPHFLPIPGRRRKKKDHYSLLTVKYKSYYLQNTCVISQHTFIVSQNVKKNDTNIYIHISSKHCCNVSLYPSILKKTLNPFLTSIPSNLHFPSTFYPLNSSSSYRIASHERTIQTSTIVLLITFNININKNCCQGEIFFLSFFLFSLALCYVIHAWIRRMARIRACARVLPPILRTGRIGFADSPISRGDRPRQSRARFQHAQP